MKVSKVLLIKIGTRARIIRTKAEELEDMIEAALAGEGI